MAYIGSSPTKVVSRQSANIFTYTATANQTAFTGADANGNTLACSPSDIMVHMNGIKLEESDYTATTTTVTLVSGAAAGDEVTITAFLTFESADHYTKSAADTRYVNATGDTMSGNLGIGGSPKPYLSAYKALDMNTGRSSIMSSTGTPQTWMMTNSYYDSTNSRNEYSLSSHAASYYLQQAGEHSFATAPSGTADAAITFTERMKIDNDGRVTMPYQPAFNVVGNQSTYTSLVTAGGTTNAIPFNIVRGNGTSGFNTSTHVFTAPVAGSYLFTLYTLISSAQNHESYMYKNGSLYARKYTSSGRATSFSSIIPMAVNDYVVFGCDYSVYLNSSNSNYTSASISLIG